MCAYFQGKRTTLTFLVLVCPKMELRLEIQKTNVGIKIKFFEMLCVPIFRQNERFLLFLPKFPQKWILGSELQKPKSGFEASISKIPCV